MSREQLQQILDYRNEDVISRFVDQYSIDEDEAEDIFTETRKFLYLVQRPGIFIPDELLIIDEMWHNFILFTKEYDVFSQRCFGRYLHHLPASKAEKDHQRRMSKEDPIGTKERFHEKLSHIIGQTYDVFGDATARKWFRDYPVRYSSAVIAKLRR